MKNKNCLFSLFLAFVLLFCAFPINAMASTETQGNATSYTYTLSSDGKWVRSQDAYLAGKISFMDSPLKTPEDIFAKNGKLYVAQSEGSNIIILDIVTGKKETIGEGELNTPSGVFVDNNQNIYVADSGLCKVVVFDKNGKKINEYTKPTAQSYGKNTAFKPLKVAVDNAGILSVVCDGSYDGIVQISQNGDFLGYFGYNTVPVTFTEVIQDKFFTEEQKQKLFNKIPLTFYNIAEDSQGIVYTITQSSSGNAVKKHNVSGSNIITTQMADEINFVDISVSSDGNIFAITETGMIFEYDNDGNLLFTFGGYAISSERNGLLTVASGITVDDKGLIYVLDKERGLVHSYVPTAFTTGLHDAISLYRDGNYKQSREELNNLLMLSGNVSVIYEYLGKDEAQLKNFEKASEYYKKAGNRTGYSDAFWEIRNQKIGKYLAIFLIIIIALILMITIIKKIIKAKNITFNKIKTNREFLNYTYGFRMLKHPFDSCYEIKVGRAGSMLSASVIYLLALVMFILEYLYSGFAFNQNSIENTSLLFVVFLFVVPVGLFVLCSFMVTEINDGKGSFKKIYMAMSYSLMPLIILLPIATILTHILTLSESFIITMILVAAYAWTGYLIVISIKEIHEYGFMQVFLNILITLFMMIVCVFVVSILYMFWDKVIEVFSSIFREVKYRVLK